MLTRTQTIERNMLRALAQREADISLLDDIGNARAEELACLEYDRVMTSFNECRECTGFYSNASEE